MQIRLHVLFIFHAVIFRAGIVNGFTASITAVDMGGVEFSNIEKAAVTATTSAITTNTQSGSVVSSTTDLGAGASESITITNSRCGATTDIVLVSMATPCTVGQVSVVGVTVSAGSFAVKVYNSGTSACTSAYSLVRTSSQWLVVRSFFRNFFVSRSFLLSYAQAFLVLS
jgi:hypothetical protein